MPVRVRSSDGVEIVAHELGGIGRSVLFAHATGLHGQVWRPMANRLAPHLRCISYDGRGHGASGVRPDLDFAWEGFARDVLAVVDGLHLSRPVGVGHSSGATALLLAEQSRPGTFAALYCFEAIVVPADPPLGRDPQNWLAGLARKRRETFASRDQAYADFAQKRPYSLFDPAVLRGYVDHGFEDLASGEVTLRCRREHEALVHEMATANDCFVHLAALRCPVVLARGDQNDHLGPAPSAPLLARLPDASTEVLTGLHHFGPLEDSDRAARSVRAFVERCPD